MKTVRKSAIVDSGVFVKRLFVKLAEESAFENFVWVLPRHFSRSIFQIAVIHYRRLHKIPDTLLLGLACRKDI